MSLLSTIANRVSNAFASETSVFRVGKQSPRIPPSVLPFDPYFFVADKVLDTADKLRSSYTVTKVISTDSDGITHVLNSVDEFWNRIASDLHQKMDVKALDDMIFQLKLQKDIKDSGRSRIVIDIMGKSREKGFKGCGPECAEGYLPFDLPMESVWVDIRGRLSNEEKGYITTSEIDVFGQSFPHIFAVQKLKRIETDLTEILGRDAIKRTPNIMAGYCGTASKITQDVLVMRK